jgi:formylglycine-generating enzyme required for sulfatase activity
LEEEICVPGGAVEIGCEDEGADCYPRHTVYLTPYYIDRYPAVVGRYQECVDAGACSPLSSFLSWDSELYDDVVEGYPGAQIRTATHEQAVAFCEWDGAELVTGAQWERAAIGVNTGRVYFPWDRPGPVSLTYCDRLHAYPCGCGTCGVYWFPTDDLQTHLLDVSSINVSVMWNYYEWTSDALSPYPTDGTVVANPRYEPVDASSPFEHRGWDIRDAAPVSARDIAFRNQTRHSGNPDRGSFRCSRAAIGSRQGG